MSKGGVWILSGGLALRCRLETVARRTRCVRGTLGTRELGPATNYGSCLNPTEDRFWLGV